MLEIAAVAGNTVSFTTPLHLAFDTAHRAQLTRYTVPYGAKHAGVEDLSVRGGRDDNITVRFALYSWVKNVESDWSLGDGIALDSCFRCVLRDSWVHDTPEPFPGGNGYLLSLARYTADSLVENSIFTNGNKVMVMRATGGGNVIAYNYFDNGYIGDNTGWMETGLNASHMTRPTTSCSRETRPSTSTGTTPGAGPSTTPSSATTPPASGARTRTPPAGARSGSCTGTTTTASSATCWATRA